jgi:proline iminopeptidase
MSSSPDLSPGQHSVTLDQLTYEYHVQSQSPTLPLLIFVPPGWGIGPRVYMSTFTPLLEFFTLVFFVPRGNGSSSRPDNEENMSNHDMASDIEKFRIHLNLPKINLMGHSTSGEISLAYATCYPDKVDKLVLLCSSCSGIEKTDRRLEDLIARKGLKIGTTDEDFHNYLTQFFPLLFPDPADFAKIKDLFTARVWTYRTFYAANARLVREGWIQRELLEKVQAKCLVLVGREDLSTPPDISERIHKGISGSELVIYEGCGHFPWIDGDMEKRFWRETVEFLQTH